MFDHKNLLSIDELSAEDIMTVLTYAKTFEEVNERPIKKVPALRGKTICNLFLEPSTRTRGSFELAEKRLSCDTINAGGSASSTVKGESLVDTVKTLDSMKVDMFVVRHKYAGTPYMVSQLSLIHISLSPGKDPFMQDRSFHANLALLRMR